MKGLMNACINQSFLAILDPYGAYGFGEFERPEHRTGLISIV